MKPRSIQAIIGRKRYDTDTATLLAGDDWWDGHNFKRSGRNTFLYRTPKGSSSPPAAPAGRVSATRSNR